jgi:hypothetical protein
MFGSKLNDQLERYYHNRTDDSAWKSTWTPWRSIGKAKSYIGHITSERTAELARTGRARDEKPITRSVCSLQRGGTEPAGRLGRAGIFLVAEEG